MVIVDYNGGDVLMCYVCYQNVEGGELLYWLPPDPENYPAKCELCGRIKTVE